MNVRLLPHRADQIQSPFPPEGVSLGMKLMGAPALWEAGFQGADITVAVIDTGIDDTHPDLAKRVLDRRDYVRDSHRPDAFHPHGTHVAGTIAADGPIKGVAPKALLRDYRVLDPNGAGQNDAIVHAIRDAVDDGCHIINLSLGGPDDDPSLHKVIQYAVRHNVLVIVAVGNEGPDHISYPGYYPEVVGVGAVSIGADGGVHQAAFSSTNKEVDLCVPGVDILSCAPGGGYMTMSGTSMASPHAAGFAALILQRSLARLGRPITEEAAWQALKTSTVDVEALGIDAGTGAGFLSVYPTLPKVRAASL